MQKTSGDRHTDRNYVRQLAQGWSAIEGDLFETRAKQWPASGPVKALTYWALALTFCFVAGLGLQLQQRDNIGRSDKQAVDVTKRAAAQIDSVLQSAGTLAELLANEAATPGGRRDFNARLTETLRHFPAVAAIELAEPGGKVIAMAHRDGTVLPVIGEFSEISPRHDWDGVTLLHINEASSGSGLIAMRARARATRDAGSDSLGNRPNDSHQSAQITVFLRGRDLPAIKRMFGASWLFGYNHKLVADLDGPADANADAVDAVFRGLEGSDADRGFDHPIKASIGDTPHLLIASPLPCWPIDLVVDTGAISPFGAVGLWSLRGVIGLSLLAALVVALRGVMALRGWRLASVAAQANHQSATSRIACGEIASRNLAALVSHEFNNLLTIVAFDAEMLSQSTHSAAPAGQLSRSILAASRRGAELTQQLLAYSEIALLHPRAVDLALELGIRRSEFETILTADQKLLILSIAMGDSGRLVMVDSDALVACLSALLRKLSHESGPQAQLRLDVVAYAQGGRDYVCLVLATDIATRDADLVRASQSRPRAPIVPPDIEQSQLSLSIAAASGFARQSGGWLEMEGEAGQWCRMRFVLPAYIEAAEMQRPPTASSITTAPPLARERTPLREAEVIALPPRRPITSLTKVLLVDDSVPVRESMARHLRGLGYDVVEARDAADAQEWLARGVDVLVTDIVLNDAIDGWALATWARERDANLPLVFISGFLSARQAEVMATDELASFVRKPVEAGDLRAVIDGLLALRETKRLTRKLV